VRRAAAVLALLLVGCFDPGPGPGGWNADPDCANNNPPAIGNVEINSIEVLDEDVGDDDAGDDDDSVEPVRWFSVSVHFDWVDPGVSGAEDPPNLIGGGFFSAEVFGADVPDYPFTRPNLVAACAMPATAENPDPCSVYGHGQGGCSSEGAVDTCNTGEFTVPLAGEGGFPNDRMMELQFRIRDACSATSNEKSASYLPGSGMAVEGGGE